MFHTMVQSLTVSKATKTNMIKALSEMSPEVRSMIAEVSYAPAKNKQNRIKILQRMIFKL